MSTYCRVTMNAGYAVGSRFWFELIEETERFIVGYKVNREGEPLECTSAIDRKHMIDKAAISKMEKAEFDKKYCELSVSKAAQ